MPTNQFVPNTTIGLLLIVMTSILWSALPIALKFTLDTMDGVTITWFRFALAAVICLLWQGARGKLTQFKVLNARDWMILTLAGVFMTADYVGFTVALNYISPIASAVFAQVTPFFLCIGGVIVFKERLSRFQISCFVVLFIGLMLFFNDSFTQLSTGQDMWILGAVITIVAALLWVFYALMQKQLLAKLSAMNILLYIYGLAVVMLAPLTDFSSFAVLDNTNWSILIFCALNTVVAYAAFAQSMKHIDTTTVSIVIAIMPLLTIGLVNVSAMIWPEHIIFERINLLGWIGVVLVVGSVVSFNLFVGKAKAVEG